MNDARAVRIFISSPADVRPERLKAEQIVARLDREFAYHFHVEAVLWEREPLVATHHFQDPENIPQPRGTDIVVVILWSRLGVLLPEEERFRGAVSGRLPVTGTEWEFEDALASARERNVPDLLLYRKTARINADLDDETALEEARAQRAAVHDFIGRWFRADSGPGYTAASHSFAATAEFEQQLYDHLRALLERRAGPPGESAAIRWHDAPYRGLPAYEFEHAPIFFGRTWARNALRELLTQRISDGVAFVLVFGASGSGKSSLVKAGLLPDLAIPGMIGRVGLVRRAVMRPAEGGGPLAALAAAILSPSALPELPGLHYSAEQLAGLLRAAPRQATLPIRQGLAEAGKTVGLTDIAEARLVIVVDQLEEMFTVESLSDGDRATFVAALDTLARSGLVWVVATMRSDFFDRLETMPALAALSAEGRFLLLPPGDAEIGQIIRQPALEAGLRFEHDLVHGINLDEIIREAAVKDRNALPLLSFLLDQLWQRRSRRGELTLAAYEELGGLEGSIGHRAEEVFQLQNADVQGELVPLLRELVKIEGGKPVSRTALFSRFPEGSPRRVLVDVFLAPEARLLVSDRGQVRLAHEAILTHWPRAMEQVVDDTRDLELRGKLEREAEAWRAAPRREQKGRVISGLQLAEARALLDRWSNALPGEIADFINISRGVARRRRLRLWGLVASSPAIVALLAVIAWAGLVWWGVREIEANWAAEQEFVRIPPADVRQPYCFDMGSPASEEDRSADEGPVHQVCVRPFDLAKFEVTHGEWRRVMIFPNTSDPSRDKGNDLSTKEDRDRLPVEEVSWNEAQRFLWLMSVFGHHQYRLPSEAEWEYAARAGNGTVSRYWGNDIDLGCEFENIADQSLKRRYPYALQSYANCDDGYIYPAPVGLKRPNPWGLYDMLGNVENWVEDCYAPSYDKTPTDGSPNLSDICPKRVIRGGSWYDNPRLVRAARRNSDGTPDTRNAFIGLRVARTIAP